MSNPPMIYVFAKRNGTTTTNCAITVGKCTGYRPYGPLYGLDYNAYDLKYRCLNNSTNQVNGSVNYAVDDIENTFDPNEKKIVWKELTETNIETSQSILELYVTNQVIINNGSVSLPSNGSNKPLRDARLTVFSYPTTYEFEAIISGDNTYYDRKLKPNTTDDYVIAEPQTYNIYTHEGEHVVSNGWIKASLNRGVRMGRGKRPGDSPEAAADVFVYNQTDITTSQNETSEKWIELGKGGAYIYLRPTAYYGVTDDNGDFITDFKDPFFNILKPADSTPDIFNSESIANVCLVMDPPAKATAGVYWFIVTVLGWYT